jgi:hypothetical protein
VVVVRSRPHLAAASAFGARGFLALRAGRNLPNLDDMWIDYNCTRRDGQLWQIGESFAHKGQWTRKAALILIAESIPLLGDVVTLLYSIPLLMPPYITLHNPTPHLPFPEGSVDTLSQQPSGILKAKNVRVHLKSMKTYLPTQKMHADIIQCGRRPNLVTKEASSEGTKSSHRTHLQ